MKSHNVKLLYVVTLFVVANVIILDLDKTIALLILICLILVNILIVLSEISGKIKTKR